MAIERGDRLTGQRLIDVPPGTLVRLNNDEYLRLVSGWGSPRHGTTYGVDALYSTTRQADVVEVGEYCEAYASFVSRFATTVLAQAYRHSIGIDPVHAALRRLEVELRGAVGVGEWFDPYDQSVRPIDGSLSMMNTEYPEFYSVAQYTAGGWKSLIGHPTPSDLARFVVETPDSVGTVPVYQPGDEDRILRFKAKAWTVGDRARRDSSWCGSYLDAMRKAGVTADSRHYAPVTPGGARIGDTVSPDVAAAMPVGTVFRHIFDDGRFALFVRDNVGNAAMTRRLVGQVNRHFLARMEVVASPGDTMDITVHSVEELEAMPVGTQMGEPPATHSWEKREDQRWYRVDMPDRRGTESRIFGIDTLRYLAIPGVNR